ncbi:MAG TPA: FUSC family membrane protein, partial [Chitinophagaceae bacterium]|nr:FUSC family membrane protein [Chitinophagaceae bacterium]
MLISIAVIFFMAMATGFIASNSLLLGIWIAASCFGGAMIAVYGERASAIGLCGLIVMALVIGRVDTGSGFILNALYMAAGATWYTILSLALHRIRPYRLPQQALGDCVISTANYLRTRTLFYDPKEDFDKVYQKLMEAQVEVHQQQALLRELLFKSRDIIKESTNTSRTLLMIFVDSVDLFEKSTTSFYDYNLLRRQFAGTGILEEFKLTIQQMAEELDRIGLAVKIGEVSAEPVQMQTQLKSLQGKFEEFRKASRKTGNIEGIITLRRVLNGIEDIAARIYTLYNYTKYDKAPEQISDAEDGLKSFVTPQSYSWKLLPANITLQSNIFRHALRLTFATIVGYLISIL